MEKPALTLKQFMVRRQVLKLYKDFFRTVRRLPEGQERRELADLVRDDFKRHKGVSPAEEERVLALFHHGQRSLNELKQTLDLSRADGK